MSVVTDIILCEFDTVGHEPLDCPPIDQINQFLHRFNAKLLKVDEYAGGNKVMQVGVWMAAVNHLGPGLEEVVFKQQWRYPECVQLLVKQEHDCKFLMVLDGL